MGFRGRTMMLPMAHHHGAEEEMHVYAGNNTFYCRAAWRLDASLLPFSWPSCSHFDITRRATTKSKVLCSSRGHSPRWSRPASDLYPYASSSQQLSQLSMIGVVPASLDRPTQLTFSSLMLRSSRMGLGIAGEGCDNLEHGLVAVAEAGARLHVSARTAVACLSWRSKFGERSPLSLSWDEDINVQRIHGSSVGDE